MGKIREIFLNETPGGNVLRPYDSRPAGQGRIPISPQFSSGAPSMDPSVQMSQKQQTIMTDQDREYWEDASFDPPYDLNQNRTGDLDIDLNGIQKESKMNKLLQKFIFETIKDMVDEDDAQDKDNSEIDEFSAVGGGGGAAGAGAIRGHMGSKLPMKNKKKLGQR